MNEETKISPRRKFASKSFVDRMTSIDSDPDDLDKELEVVRKNREFKEESDMVVFKP